MVRAARAVERGAPLRGRPHPHAARRGRLRPVLRRLRAERRDRRRRPQRWMGCGLGHAAPRAAALAPRAPGRVGRRGLRRGAAAPARRLPPAAARGLRRARRPVLRDGLRAALGPPHGDRLGARGRGRPRPGARAALRQPRGPGDHGLLHVRLRRHDVPRRVGVRTRAPLAARDHRRARRPGGAARGRARPAGTDRHLRGTGAHRARDARHRGALPVRDHRPGRRRPVRRRLRPGCGTARADDRLRDGAGRARRHAPTARRAAHRGAASVRRPGRGARRAQGRPPGRGRDAGRRGAARDPPDARDDAAAGHGRPRDPRRAGARQRPARVPRPRRPGATSAPRRRPHGLPGVPGGADERPQARRARPDGHGRRALGRDLALAPRRGRRPRRGRGTPGRSAGAVGRLRPARDARARRPVRREGDDRSAAGGGSRAHPPSPLPPGTRRGAGPRGSARTRVPLPPLPPRATPATPASPAGPAPATGPASTLPTPTTDRTP